MGTAITLKDGRLVVPDNPIIPFIEGDGTGPDIWRASVRVLDEAVAKSYGGKRKIAWLEVFAGEKSFKQFNNWLPDETVEAFRTHLVGIKGPLTTPVGGGIRSLNVALRTSNASASARSARSASAERPGRASTIQPASARRRSTAEAGKSSAMTIFNGSWSGARSIG